VWSSRQVQDTGFSTRQQGFESPWGYLASKKHSHPANVVPYVLRGQNKRYVGITNNLPRRIAEHQSGRTKAGQIIGRFIVLHVEQFPDYRSARNREKFFKSGRGREFLNVLDPGTGPASGG
jgi:putative endonuclease